MAQRELEGYGSMRACSEGGDGPRKVVKCPLVMNNKGSVDTAIECDYLFPLLVIRELPVRQRFSMRNRPKPGLHFYTLTTSSRRKRIKQQGVQMTSQSREQLLAEIESLRQERNELEMKVVGMYFSFVHPLQSLVCICFFLFMYKHR